MGSRRPCVFIAVDTNVLLDEELRSEDVLDALGTIRERIKGVRFIVTPTVLHELAYAAIEGSRPEKRATAKGVLENMLVRGYQPLNLIPAGHGIVEQIGFKLRAQSLLPEEEENDSFIIAEAALIGATILLSSDNHMLDAQHSGRLQKLLKDCSVDGDSLLIAKPREIVRKFMRH